MALNNPKPTSEFHARNISAPATDRLVSALDAQEADSGMRRLRDWAHLALNAQPGERVLDIGAGTGSEIRRFASAVFPDGDAVGIEPNPSLRAVARERSTTGNSGARVIDGNALALPLATGSVDVVWCERVFQHLDEPGKAAEEIARVLRPGGRVALLDSDWATSILHPGDPEVAAAVISGARDAAANPYAGRRLVGQLRAVGLAVDEINSQSFIQDGSTVAWPLVKMQGENAVQRELITQAQWDQLFCDLTEAADKGSLFLSVTVFGVVAHCPTG